MTADEIATRFRYAVNDTSKVVVDPGDTLGLVASWRKEALQEISSEEPFIDKIGYLHPDGDKYLFSLLTDLKSQDGDTTYTDYLKLRIATIFGSGGARITHHPQNLQYIRRLESSGSGVYSRTPDYYALVRKSIYFDGKESAPTDPSDPSISDLFTIDYWGLHPAITGSETPEYPLSEDRFMNLIVAQMLAIQKISGERGIKYRNQGLVDLTIEMPKFTKRITELDYKADSEGMIYSDLGNDEPTIEQERLMDAHDYSSLRGDPTVD